MEKCGTLRQYSEFVEKIRRFEGDRNKLERAVKECIKEDILADYLRRKSEEVVNMLMAEYDYETDLEVHCEEAEARGRAEGEARGRAEGEARGEARGEVKGMVLVYYTKLHYSVEQIAKELNLKRELVEEILQGKGLLKV